MQLRNCFKYGWSLNILVILNVYVLSGFILFLKKQWHNAYDNTPSGVPLNDDLSMPVNNSRVKRQFYDEYYDNIKIWR